MTIKEEGGIGGKTYKRIYPTGAGPLNLMGYQKSIKGHHLAHAFQQDAVTYRVAKEASHRAFAT